jgi:hypothetical protein
MPKEVKVDYCGVSNFGGELARHGPGTLGERKAASRREGWPKMTTFGKGLMFPFRIPKFLLKRTNSSSKARARRLMARIREARELGLLWYFLHSTSTHSAAQ